MDRLGAMEVFVRVAETGGFSAAARDLGLSKSAVSKHIAALEDRLGVRLLDRTTRRVSVTEAGRAYFERCLRITADVEEAELAAMALHGEPRGVLRLNAPMTFGVTHLGPALPDFLSQYPELTIELTLNDRYVDVVDEGFDVAIRIGELSDSSLIARRLAGSRRIMCAAPSYLARHGTPRTLADLADHNCLTYTYMRGNPGEWRLGRDAGGTAVQVRGSLSANNGDVILAALLAGGGISWQPSIIVGADVRAGRLVWLLPEFCDENGIYAVYPPGRNLSAKVRALVDFLAARFGPRPVWEDFDSGPSAPTRTGQ